MARHVSFTRDPLKGSLCKSCRHRASRNIIPFYEEDYGIDRKELGIPEDEDVIVEHHMCTELSVDLDHVVLDCDHYCQKGSECLISDKFYKV